MTTETLTFAQRLKVETKTTHDSVDNLVMSVQPFASKDNYLKFLQLQAIFHRIVDDIYHDAALNQAIPKLSSMARFATVQQDIQDLEVTPPTIDLASLPKPTGARAVGWLYCAEGSNLGAAFLYKQAQKELNFDEHRGARHLAAHEDGRAPHWREFVDHLNNLPLDQAAANEAIEGAKDAFTFYKQALRQVFHLPAAA